MELQNVESEVKFAKKELFNLKEIKNKVMYFYKLI